MMFTLTILLFALLSPSHIMNVSGMTMSSVELDRLFSLLNDPVTTTFLKGYYNAVNITCQASIDHQDLGPIYKAMDNIALKFATERKITKSVYLDSVKNADVKVRVAVEKLYNLFDLDKNDVIDSGELAMRQRARMVFSYIDILILGADTNGDYKVSESELKTHLAAADYVTSDAHREFLIKNFNYVDLNDDKVVDLYDLQLLFPSLTMQNPF